MTQELSSSRHSDRVMSGWLPWQPNQPDAPAPAVLDLLRCEASLTAALRDHSDDQLGLRVLREESTTLASLQTGELVSATGVVREVVLSGRGVPWVFAQTLIPEATSAAHSWLSAMGGRPLGDALFHHPDVSRSELTFAQLVHGCALYDRALALGLAGSASFLWARRSYFYLGAERLLITEVFLPGLCPAS